MNKKKISIIVGLAIVLLIIGLGFNALFSNANKINNMSNSNSSNIEESNEEIKDQEDIENKVESLDNNEITENIEEKDNLNKEEVVEEIVENSKEDNFNDSNSVNNTNTSNDSNTSNESNVSKDNNVSNDSSNNINNPVENNSSTNGESSNNTTVEENKPATPVQPEKVTETVTISISCKTAINSELNSTAGFTHLPGDGMILYSTKVEIQEGDTVFNILQRITKKNTIHMEYTGSASTIYVEGINNLYEFDGGQGSGWMYSVNGWYPNYGCGSYTVKANDVIQWNYTLDLGKDLGAGRN